MARHVPVLSLAILAGLAVPARTQAQVKLEYKFAEGTKASVKDTTKLHQVLSIAGMDVETDVDQTLVATATVGKRNADGTLPIAHKIESLRAEISLPGGVTVGFDSAAPDAPIDNQQFAFLRDVFKALVGASHTIVLDAANKVKFVEGTEGFDAKLEGLDPKAAAILKKQMSADALKKSFEKDHSSLPDVLAREGEPWEATVVDDIGGDQTLTLRKRFEYRGTVEKEGRTLDKIGVEATEVTYAMSPDSESPVKVSKSDLKIDSSEGTLLFDREAGAVVESQEVTRIKGVLTLDANGQELPSKLDLTMEKATRLEKPSK